MKYRYTKAEEAEAKVASSCIEYCYCTGQSKKFPNVSAGDEWKKQLHIKMHGLDQTACPDLTLEFQNE